MSILIKGMEMPKSCGECYVGFCKQIGCELSIGFDDYKISRHPNCPLVPVPPHGRLIDADALLDDLLFPSKQFEQGMRELIGDAPTIIPAEEATPKDGGQEEAPAKPYDLLYEEGGAGTT